MLNIACIQHPCGADRAQNLHTTLTRVRAGAPLVVLQELRTGVYFRQTENTTFFDWAEHAADDNATRRQIHAIPRHHARHVVDSGDKTMKVKQRITDFDPVDYFDNDEVIAEYPTPRWKKTTPTCC